MKCYMLSLYGETNALIRTAWLRNVFFMGVSNCMSTHFDYLINVVFDNEMSCPILFNAVLEHAMRKWKLKLINESLKLGQDIRLTMVTGQWSTLYAPLGSLFQAQWKCETISYIHYRLQKCKNSGSINDHKS